MTTDWTMLGSLVIGVGASIGLAYALWTSRESDERRKKLACPCSQQAADLIAVRDRRLDRFIDVRRCSAPNAGTPECKCACLDALNGSAPDAESTP